MALRIGRLSTRMWLLATIMSVLTVAIALTTWGVLNAVGLYGSETASTRVQVDQLVRLVRAGDLGSERYRELSSQISGAYLGFSTWVLVVLTALLSTLTGSGVALFFARRIGRPIEVVSQAAASFAAGDRAARAVVQPTYQEAGELVAAFNAMAAKLDSLERERKVLTAGIAHELRTPLTILGGRVTALCDGLVEADGACFAQLLRQVEHLSRVVDDLRLLAYADAGELTLDLASVDVGALSWNLADDLSQVASMRSVAIVVDAERLTVRADPVRLAQIVTNLLNNAINHSPAGGVVRVSVACGDGWVRVSVADEGPGLAEGDAHRMFLPFWRSRESIAARRPGIGMGLALAARLAELHGGTIDARNRDGCPGAIVELALASSGC